VSDRADREVAGIVHSLVASGLRKCTPRAVEARVGKRELEDLLSAAGLGGPLQGRVTARILCCDEKTLRRWRDPLCGKDLAPPDIRIILQGRSEERRRSA
jgi:hypothetical protein